MQVVEFERNRGEELIHNTQQWLAAYEFQETMGVTQVLIVADKNLRHPENAAGKWYVDDTCIICGLCGEYAPKSFRVSADGVQNVVYKQPQTEEELAEAKQAMEDCPLDSIGNNG